ncbi:uncharacterized protein LOC143148009 isoform X2 [Ptiloglossa arizonensis]|uniref:uncharacterized protein LOC143148009 isoform X2 n=1 Tax=Ptiloglossa arizonensis TaxID=3350558 RepID=UPI003FA03BA5
MNSCDIIHKNQQLKECSLENLIYNKMLQVKLKDSLCNITEDSDLNMILTQDTNKQACDKVQTEIIENLPLLKNQLILVSSDLAKCLADLVYLNLSDNQLSDLPHSLNVLKKLVYLNLDCNQFSYIPNIVCELTNLRTLKASKNRLEDVTNHLENLSHLEDLDLSSNKLMHLPTSYANLNRLKNLYLTNNRFKQIPSCVAHGMCSLQIFDFSQNSCSELDISPKSVNLTAFYAERNIVCPLFPTWILNPRFNNLKIVSLNQTIFKKFHLPKIQYISCIKKLSMKQCKLSETIIDKLIARMTSLEELIIGSTRAFYRNGFWRMPFKSLKELSNLKELDFSGTGISVVSKSISNFINLSILNMSCNSIIWLPEEICSLRNLSSLILDNNNITILPENIGELVSLKELKACHNNLREIPDTFGTLNNLEYIDLYDNEFETMPETVTKLPNLIGVDIEQNYFLTNNLLLNRDIHYENMRDVLRKHWHEDNERLDGVKLQPSETSELSDDERFSSLSRSTTDSSLENQNLCALPERTFEVANERWDSSDDSADEFDPHEHKEPRRRVYSPFTFYKPFQRVYCPGEFHQKRIMRRVVEMLQNGTLVWPTKFEEGQFEDS